MGTCTSAPSAPERTCTSAPSAPVEASRSEPCSSWNRSCSVAVGPGMFGYVGPTGASRVGRAFGDVGWPDPRWVAVGPWFDKLTGDLGRTAEREAEARRERVAWWLRLLIRLRGADGMRCANALGADLFALLSDARFTGDGTAAAEAPLWVVVTRFLMP